jgi:nucleoid-associated protein YgaU
VAALSKAAGDAIATYIGTQGLQVDGLDVGFDAPTTTVTVSGSVADQATKEKVLLCCGNVANVAAVNDMLTVSTPEPESQWHAVVSGDNLSKIAKKFYGDPQQVPGDLRGQQADADAPGQDLPGADAAHPAAL